MVRFLIFRKVIWLFVFLSILYLGCQSEKKEETKTPKAVYIIVDGIPGDVIQKLNPPVLAEISKAGGFTLAYVGGGKGMYSESPTISAVGYNSLLTGTWTNKHNVWDNDIAAPNYHYWTLFRTIEKSNPGLKTAIFSTWEDNRTKLIGEGLEAAGGITLDFKFDGLEHDTVKFPHGNGRQYIQKIDEAVTDEASRIISTEAPDLSWIYLEYTDDMGHQFGDSPQFQDAIMVADKQIGKVWNAIREREKNFNEDWLIIVTTDHGRDSETGHNHGGQSDRERSAWIVTNARNLNTHFSQHPSIVDLYPTLLRHLQVKIPEEVAWELDGVPLAGELSLADLHAVKDANKILVTWKSLDKNSAANVEIFITSTNRFKEGGKDDYRKAGECKVNDQKFEIELNDTSNFYKIVLKTPNQFANVWVMDKK